MKTRFGVMGLALGCALVSGCQTTVPSEALVAKQEPAEMRRMQSRRFDGGDEKKILAASAALLQDLGFNLEESSSELGLLVASKDRSAVESGQVVTSVVVALLTGVSAPYDENQRFRASVTTRVTDDKKSVIVRVTFQRTVWNTARQITRNEALNKPQEYQEFFQKLSKAAFLEANDL